MSAHTTIDAEAEGLVPLNLDLLQIGFGGGERLAVFSLELRRDAKKGVDAAVARPHRPSAASGSLNDVV
jgi:hypothetical protein